MKLSNIEAYTMKKNAGKAMEIEKGQVEQSSLKECLRATRGYHEEVCSFQEPLDLQFPLLFLHSFSLCMHFDDKFVGEL